MFLVCLLTSGTWLTQAHAQVIYPMPAAVVSPVVTTQVRAPNGTAAAMRAVTIITATEAAALGTSAPIQSFGFNLQATPFPNAMTGTANIYLLNTTDVTNSKGLDWTVATTGMTQVCTNCAFTVAPNATSYDITLSTNFNYTGGGMYVAYDFTITSTLFPSTTAADPIATYLANNLLPASTASYQGTAPASNTLGTGFSSFRPEMRIGRACTPVVVTPASGSPNFTNGTAIAPITLSASGGFPAATYTYVITGTLPAGVTLAGNTISGTPGVLGAGSFTVTATSTPGNCTSSATYTYFVNPAACTAVTVLPASGAVNFPNGTPITNITLSATGGGGTPYAFSIISGADRKSVV